MNSNYETKVFHVHTEGDRFGFTLAGQFPCQLVKIQHGSPAEKAGLKSGDEVIEVNGVNVEDLKHDCVASFIAPLSAGITELRIRRILCCPCERTVERTRDVQKYVSEDRVLNLSKIVDRVVEEFKRPATPINNTPSPTMRKGLDLNNGSDLASDEELRASFVLDTTSLHTTSAANISTPLKASNFAQNTEHVAQKPSKIEAVVGYLGSIERPAATRSTSDSLVARLSLKTKTPALVLLEVSSNMGLCLSNSSKQLIMTYPINSLMYAGICPENKQVIGLFTKHLNMEGRNKVINDGDVAITSDCNLNCSCHLFMIEPSLIRHPNHKSLTDRFQLRCVPDPGTGSCQQFPTSSAAILNTLSAYLKGSSTAQIASTERHRRLNVSLSGRQVEDSKQSGVILVEESCKDDPCSTSPWCQAEQGDTDSQHGQVLCLHLQPLGHGCMTKETEMDCKRQGDYSSGIRSINRPTTSQKSTSVSFISTTGTTSSRINHVQCMSTEERFKLDKSGPKDLLKPPNKGKESHGGHKTLVHRRSQSLASSVANTLQAVSAIQSLECYSQSDFRIGNGNRPVFHASSANMVACNNALDGKVARWAVGFDRLLEDKTGMDIFRSFLQKEYSEENLIFWLACEKYRTIEDKNELKTSAEDIYETHLKACATLPVNVESKAIRDVEEQLECPTMELFKALQHQVYTLMKFDSYTRFLKSELYQQCLVNEMEGKPLPIEQVEESKKEEEGTSTLKRMFSSTKGKGRKSGTKSQTLQNNTETDESKKKSFLPWRGRLKSDQTKRTTNRSSDSQASSTRSSLSSLSDSVFSSNITNSDEALNDSDGKDQPPPSCRVILPDRSMMYLFCKSTRSLKEGLSKLCEKKEYSLPALDLFVANRKLTKGNLERKLTRFINKEIVLKQGVLFRVQLPNDRIVGVKADDEQTIDKILAPILQQFGFDIKDVTMHFRNNKQPLNTGSSVSSLHQEYVIVEDHSGSEVRNTDKNIAETRETHLRTTMNNNGSVTVRLSAPSNEYAVFTAIMNGKRQSMSGFCFDENGVFVPVVKQVKSNDTLSTTTKEKERLTRSPALFRKKKRDGPQSVSTFQTFIVEDDKKETEEFFSLLRRSQKSRIDDQRGLLKKAELPDFLKLPEKTNRRNNFLHVGVPSPRARHHSLKKSTSSPPTYTAWASQQARSQPSTIAEQPKPREASVTRNWSGSSLHRSRTQVETTTQVVTQVIETQTIDRKRFLKPSQDTTVNRLRAGSLPQDHPDDRSRELLGGNELKGRSRYHYGSEASFGSSSEKQVVWVSNAMNRNRRRGSNRTNHSTDAINEGQTDDESHSRLVEVIIPETKTDTGRFAITGGVVPYCDRPKPITDSTYFREYLESSNLHMPTHDDESKARDFESANDREAILDNSFLRDELKPSRLFSQLSPEMSTPLESLSPVERRRQKNEGSAKCPLFIPPNITLTPGDEVLAGRNTLRTYENHAGSTNTSFNSYDDQDLESTRHAYWSQSEMTTDEEAVRVTFV